MIKRWIFAIGILLACSNSAFALLPPYFQSIREIEQIVKDERLHDALGSGQPILEIQKMGHSYVIFTPKHSLRVNVIYKPLDKPGPAKFELQFEKTEDLILPHPSEAEVF